MSSFVFFVTAIIVCIENRTLAFWEANKKEKLFMKAGFLGALMFAVIGLIIAILSEG